MELREFADVIKELRKENKQLRAQLAMSTT